MRFIACFVCITIAGSTLFSCKKEVKNLSEGVEKETEKTIVVPVPEKKDLSTEEVDQVNSIMLKSMVTPELKTFTSMLVSTGLSDLLSKEKGPFTIIGPSDQAFLDMGQLQMKDLINSANLDKLTALIKGHIIKGELSSATLVQRIKEGNGSYTISAMSGAEYIVSREDTAIIITDVTGASARLGKSDIMGFNGVVHVLDKVLMN
jgi:uncharacterized surface protein with fasciclin (FAS1) repeats